MDKRPRSKLRMKDIPLMSRPREKMLGSSPKSLTDSELLAALLGTGMRGKSAVSLGESILKRYSGKKLAQVSFSDLVAIPGVGKSKATRIMAAFELGERFFASPSLTKVIIRSGEDVLSQVRDIAEKKQEHLVVLYLNARHELLQKEVVGMGTVNNLRLTPREIFAPALQLACASLIIVHNHPSGDPEPSDDDIHFTTKMHEAGEMLGIPLADHLIISKSGYFSFKDGK